MSGVTTDPVAVREGAQRLQDRQDYWAKLLEQNPPRVPAAAFGVGLQGKGARLMDAARRGHDVRVAHARRLHAAGADAQNLANVLERTDASNADSLRGDLR